MGVDLNVWANHKLRFNSCEEGIEQFENMTSKKVKPWNFKKDKPLDKTKIISDVAYFTDFELLNQSFEYNHEIRVWTNFEFCNELKILKKTIKFYPTNFRTRYNKWQELVSENFESNDELESSNLKDAINNWIQFREYVQKTTENLKGNKILYLNDHSYQNEEDLFFQGKSLSEGISKLSEIAEPIELELLKLFPHDARARMTWFFDEISDENKR